MRHSLIHTTLLIATVSILSSFNKQQKTDTLSIDVVNCMSSITYQLCGDSVLIKRKLYDEHRFSTDPITIDDRKRFLAVAKQLLQNQSDEILINNCVADGFDIKAYISLNGQKKKVFVGNYYDCRIDSLVTIFDKFINRDDDILKYNAFRYSKSAQRIKEMIDHQNACDNTLSDEMRKHLLDSFCEY